MGDAIFTKICVPSTDFPEYSIVVGVSRTEAWNIKQISSLFTERSCWIMSEVYSLIHIYDTREWNRWFFLKNCWGFPNVGFSSKKSLIFHVDQHMQNCDMERGKYRLIVSFYIFSLYEDVSYASHVVMTLNPTCFLQRARRRMRRRGYGFLDGIYFEKIELLSIKGQIDVKRQNNNFSSNEYTRPKYPLQ